METNTIDNKVKVNAVVVTYNRVELLKECVTAIENQTYKINKLFIINNASTDNTIEEVEKMSKLYGNIVLNNLDTNGGGSLGFYKGIRAAYFDECDYVWAMDDDTIPSPTALEKLVNSLVIIEEKISFLSSAVYGLNNESMNVPIISKRIPFLCNDPFWYKYLDKGIVEIEKATLVSLFVSTDAIKSCGLPHPYFFIWYDDIEWCRRLTQKYGPGFFIGDSKVIHKRFAANHSIFLLENKNRIKLNKYLYRNMLVYSKYYDSKCKFIFKKLSVLLTAVRCLFRSKKYKFLKFKVVLTGYINFKTGRYHKKEFKNRFNNLEKDIYE